MSLAEILHELLLEPFADETFREMIFCDEKCSETLDKSLSSFHGDRR